MLYSVHAGKGDDNRFVVEEMTKRCRIISHTHDGSHFGVNRTEDVVSEKHYCPGLTKDIRLHVSIIIIIVVYICIIVHAVRMLHMKLGMVFF